MQDAETSREIPITQILAEAPGSDSNSISAGVIGAIVAAAAAIILLGVLVGVYVTKMRKRKTSSVRHGGTKSTVGSSNGKAGMPSTMMSNRSFVVRFLLVPALCRTESWGLRKASRLCFLLLMLSQVVVCAVSHLLCLGWPTSAALLYVPACMQGSSGGTAPVAAHTPAAHSAHHTTAAEIQTHRSNSNSNPNSSRPSSTAQSPTHPPQTQSQTQSQFPQQTVLPFPSPPPQTNLQFLQAGSSNASTSQGYPNTSTAALGAQPAASSGTGSGAAPVLHRFPSSGSPIVSDAGAVALGSKPTTFAADRSGSGGSGSGGTSSGKTPPSYASSSANTGFQGNNNVNVGSGGTVTSGGTGTSVLGIPQNVSGAANVSNSPVAGARGGAVMPAGQKQLAAVVEQSESAAFQSSLNSNLESDLGPTDPIVKAPSPPTVNPTAQAQADLAAAAAATAAAVGVGSVAATRPRPVGSPAGPTPLSPATAARGSAAAGGGGGTITTIGGGSASASGDGNALAAAAAASVGPMSSTQPPASGSSMPPTSQSSLTPSSGPYPQKQPLSPQEMAAQAAQGVYPQVAPSSGHDRSSDDLLKLLNEQLNMLQSSDDGVVLRRFRMSGVTSRRVGGAQLPLLCLHPPPPHKRSVYSLCILLSV